MGRCVGSWTINHGPSCVPVISTNATARSASATFSVAGEMSSE